MATNKNALWRLKLLDELLSSEWLTVKDLTERINARLSDECRALGLESEDYNVSERCIRADIEYLEHRSPWVNKGISDNETDEDESLIAREWEKLPNPKRRDKAISLRKYHYRKDGFSIFMPKLSIEEKDLLRAALSIIGQFDGMPVFKGLENLRKSLDLEPQEKIISISHNPLTDSSILGKLYLAISSKSVIELNYFLFSSPKDIKSIIFHPYLLKEYNGRWYVIGAADSDMKILNFALDRVSSIKTIKAKTFKEPSIDIEEWCEDVVGVTVDENSPIFDILFWVGDKSKHYVASKPLHISQIHHRIDDEELRKSYSGLQGGWFFSIQCRLNYELIRELTSFGEELVVLSPKPIREKIIERIDRMRQKYLSFGT